MSTHLLREPPGMEFLGSDKNGITESLHPLSSTVQADRGLRRSCTSCASRDRISDRSSICTYKVQAPCSIVSLSPVVGRYYRQ
jgi:hypothetical protein